MKHKHADVIIAWANGAQIQAKTHESVWEDRANPLWAMDREYRIKPEPKHDWGKLVRVETHKLYICRWDEDPHNANLRLTFDGETGKLKSAEVI
jgi:hypothetical protein